MRPHGYRGMGMEDFIARAYDKIEQRIMMKMYVNRAERLFLQISDESNILEIGYGPGYLTIELMKRGDVSDETIDYFIADYIKMRGLGGMFMKSTFKRSLRAGAYTVKQFTKLISQTPFTKYEIIKIPMDLEVNLFK